MEKREARLNDTYSITHKIPKIQHFPRIVGKYLQEYLRDIQKSSADAKREAPGGRFPFQPVKERQLSHNENWRSLTG